MKKPKRRWIRWVKRALWTLAAVILLSFVSGSVYVYALMRSLEGRVSQLSQIEAELRRNPTVILSDDGTVLYMMTAEYREPVSWNNLPKVVIDATVAAEDKRYWEHRGIDFLAILRAMIVNLRSGSVRQGGSTITQQVAKRLLTTGERTLRRKLEDACLALLIERQYTKEQILTLYLNQVFYGSGAYGIKAAADIYFGKDVSKLTLAEAALLARIPRRPSEENPFVNPKAAKMNRDLVLKIMLEEGKITQEEYEKAIASPIRLSPRPATQMGILRAPYFVTYVLEEMRKEFPNEDFARGGYVIETTLNIKAQQAAEKAVAETLKRERRRRVREGAIIVMNYRGEILAMVGGSDFKKSQYNVITHGHRQPGSAFKPFVYATAMEYGIIHPRSVVSNAPFVWQDPYTGKVWKPRGGGSGGWVSVQTAIVRSINVPAVHVMRMVGAEQVAKFAKDVFGFRSPLDPVLPLALGASAVSPLEMAEGYSVFATGGDRVTPYGIKRVIGPNGQIIREFAPRIIPNVLSPATAEPMRDILRRVVLSGTGRNASSVLNAAGKTGTTQLHMDAWFCGFTDELIAVAWVANATYDPKRNPPWKYEPMAGVFGGQVATRLWADALKPIQKVIGEKANKKTPKYYGGSEAGEISVSICTLSGERAIPGVCEETETKRMSAAEAKKIPICSIHREIRETSPKDEIRVEDEMPLEHPSDSPPPQASDEEFVTLEICPESGLRATIYCPIKRQTKFRVGVEPKQTCGIHGP